MKNPISWYKYRNYKDQHYRICAVSIIDVVYDTWKFKHLFIPEKEQSTLGYMRYAGWKIWDSLPDKEQKRVIIRDVGSTYHHDEHCGNEFGYVNFYRLWLSKYYREWSDQWHKFQSDICDILNDDSMYCCLNWKKFENDRGW